MRHLRILAALLLPSLLASCATTGDAPSPSAASIAPEKVEAVSLLGRPLAAPVLTPAQLGPRLVEYAEALRAFDADPESEEASIWLGRRAAYLGRYRHAIDIYTQALERHPRSYRLLRHRGHRWITLRRFDRAVADLTLASRLAEEVWDEIEPDGLPNALNEPTSTVKSNIEYHLGLAHYLRGEFAAARSAYERCLAVSTTDDMRVATAYWLWITLQRLGEPDAAAEAIAPYTAQTRVIENKAYQRLILLFKGEISPDDGEPLVPPGTGAGELEGVTYAYGLGAWHLAHGRTERALSIFRDIVAVESAWPAFGYIAAEAELARARPPKR